MIDWQVWLGALYPVKTNVNDKVYNDNLENCVLPKGPGMTIALCTKLGPNKNGLLSLLRTWLA